jgi:hypothetical protein
MITLFGQTYPWNAPEVLLLAAIPAALVGFLDPDPARSGRPRPPWPNR